MPAPASPNPVAPQHPREGADPVPRSQQPAQRFDLDFTLPADASLAALDAWLVGVMDLAPTLQAEGGTPDFAKAWLERVLLLARAMLQGVRAPLFDDPRILSCASAAQGSGFRAAMAFPVVEVVTSSIYETAIGGAIRLCAWATANAVDDGNLATFFTEMENVVLSRLARLVPGGKSTVPVLRTAHRLGIPFTHLGAGVYQVGWGSRSCRIDRSTTAHDSAIGARLTQGKRDAARVLRLAGLPAPQHVAVRGMEDALAAVKKLGWPVVIKPVDRDRGEGVTVDVADEAALATSLKAALEASHVGEALVERQVPGVCHRLFMLRGGLLYAVKRLPMSVRGDGASTVAQLVDAGLREERRRPPWLRSGLAIIDNAALQAMAAAGYAPSSVPAAGEWVPLRRIESTAGGGVDEDVGAIVHPDNIAAARRAAALFGLDVAGIDIIAEDISQPWHATQAIINEVNFSPLLGGGEISRSHIPRFLDVVVPGRGIIPIELIVGEAEALQAGTQRRDEQRDAGLRCWLVQPAGTFDAVGARAMQAVTGTRQRVRAVLLDETVDALVVVMTPDEYRRVGPPLPGLRATAMPGAQPEPAHPAK